MVGRGDRGHCRGQSGERCKKTWDVGGGRKEEGVGQGTRDGGRGTGDGEDGSGNMGEGQMVEM